MPEHRMDGTSDREHGFGWYVGWAVKDARTLVFARLSQDEREEATPAGIRTRDALLESWPMLVTPLLK
jgi:beta-lactamase class D